MNEESLAKARDYAQSAGGSGFMTRHGALVLSWGDVRKRYDLKSTSKSIGVTALGLAIKDGKLRLADRAAEHHSAFGVPPESNRETGWLGKITIRHLATQTAGFEKPGGYRPLVFEPGTKWLYSDGGPNWLAECVTLAYRKDVEDLMFERVLGPIGVTREDLKWRTNAYRSATIEGVARREFGSGVHANVDAMARLGLLYLREGTWREMEILPAEFVRLARAPVKEIVGLPVVDGREHGRASNHYGLLWWNNADGALAKVPRDAFWSWGLHDSLIVVIPSLDLVVSRAGRSWPRAQGAGHYDVLRPFLEPIVEAVGQVGEGRRGDGGKAAARGQVKASPVIAGLNWAERKAIVREARGGDNWPVTWGADGMLYTAYGDGHGFEPKVKEKLSMGFARVAGDPSAFTGVNIRTSSGERKGDGARGPKVSGLLMVKGILYALVRNTGNAQVAWSDDRGRNWRWCDWRFETSFGYPTFLNFGRDYAGARDGYVYVYSHDHESAYERADAMVLARVPADRIRIEAAYEYFGGSEVGKPVWVQSVDARKPVFVNPGRCYRSSVSYNSGLKRYLWCQTGLGRDTRYEGGLAIYDAPEPWGPWTRVFVTDTWDVGPGETSCFPTKWMSADGRTLHLVFSGNDSFSVRRANLEMR